MVFSLFFRGVLSSSCGYYRNTNPDYLDVPMCCQRAPSTGRDVVVQRDYDHEYKLAHLLSKVFILSLQKVSKYNLLKSILFKAHQCIKKNRDTRVTDKSPEHHLHPPNRRFCFIWGLLGSFLDSGKPQAIRNKMSHIYNEQRGQTVSMMLGRNNSTWWLKCK